MHYGLLAPEETILVRVYSDDTDDQVLAEIRPRYIIMYEPNQDFIRRIEVSCLQLRKRYDCWVLTWCGCSAIGARIPDWACACTSWCTT